MQPCKECDFSYDHRKAACPQCGATTRDKPEAALDESFKLKAPESPIIDRESQVAQQLKLAEEKQNILRKKMELRKMEDRLAEINQENAKLELSLGTPSPNPGQNGGGSGSLKTTKAALSQPPPGFKPMVVPAQQGATEDGPLLFYADGSPATVGDRSHLTTSTLQAGLESVGLGLQALGLAGTDASVPTQGEQSVMAGWRWGGDSVRRKRSRHWIRPDYHLPYDKSYDEMSYRELVYGMVCVTESILKSNDGRFAWSISST